MKYLSIVSLIVITMAGCSPEIGSEKWCEQVKEKPKGELTFDEAKAYAKHCVFK